MIFPIGIMVLIIIVVAIVFLYIQIVVQIYEVKSNLFYMVSSSISDKDMENLAYRDYSFNVDEVQINVDKLLKKNYLKQNNVTGIIDIECKEIKLVKDENQVGVHTNKVYKVPILCVNVNVTFKPIISLIANKVNFEIHDDIKINLLEFES